VRAPARGGEHRGEDFAGAAHRGALAADVQLVPVDANDDRNQRFERPDVPVVVSVKAQMVVEPVEGEGRFGGRTGAQRAGFLSGGYSP
jgi:hypothetical protein